MSIILTSVDGITISRMTTCNIQTSATCNLLFCFWPAGQIDNFVPEHALDISPNLYWVLVK